ncbi:MAG TPA: NADP-dependent phosphogluconate dehydrogenase [Phycisphaerales bacterium]|nr:NADP-dependent phosphogluconate dehydrogenase [Phycisphaerales bacterium]HRQ76741.1 NADP-dependent phosphogluconate dehydrogenase [Phycisphaerales bacterium]
MPHERGDCDIGLIGLAVMGQNLALNIADHGYRIAVHNRTHSVTQEFLSRRDIALPQNLVGCESLTDFVARLRTPRIVIVLVKAGAAVDAVCRSLIDAGLEPDDIVVDGGNSLWTDTIRREKEYRGSLTFFGSGVSGGELGARFGPSLMPGGDRAAWARLQPIWEAIAAKVDATTGKPLLGAQPGKPVVGGEPCTAYIGENGAGHYVKMVHNGIEYADMQLICESYHLLREALGLAPADLAEVFADWNAGELDSFLIEITADILQQADPVTGAPLVDVILDRAGQKGTGMWTAANALEMGVPAMTIAEAVFARSVSAIKDERVHAANLLRGPAKVRRANPDEFISAVRDALYCSKLCAYAQGFQLMNAAQREYNWNLNFGEIARIWRGGCIIRAVFLQKITEAYERSPDLANLLLDPFFSDRVTQLQDAWREVVATGARAGIPTPAFSSALAYYDSYRSERLPASLLQAQRDYFGAHTYERTDQPSGKRFHIDWPHPQRPQVDA